MRTISPDADAKSSVPLSSSFQPIYLLNKTFRFDIEMQQKGKALAFVGGLEIISGSTQSLYNIATITQIKIAFLV